LGAVIFQNVISTERFAASTVTLDATRRDEVFAPDAAGLHDAPPCCFQCGIDVLGSSFGFVHGCAGYDLSTRRPSGSQSATKIRKEKVLDWSYAHAILSSAFAQWALI